MEARAEADRVTARQGAEAQTHQSEQAVSPGLSQTLSINTASSSIDNKIKASLPDKFDGSASNYDSFVQSVDNFFALKSSVYSTDEIRVRTVGTLLTKSALSWFGTLVKTKSALLSNYNLFMKELERLFSDPNLKENAQQKIRNLRQGTGSALAYSSKFRILAIDTGFNNDALMAVFKNGLKEEIKDIMAKSTDPSPKTLEDLIASATRLDNRIYERKKETLEQSPKKPYFSRSLSSLTPRFKKLSYAEKQRRIKENLCLYCGDKGHSHSNCSKKKSFSSTGTSGGSVSPITPESSGASGESSR